jgi:hypothetical protein
MSPSSMGSSFNVAGDRDELTRLFGHLVDNALKYGAAAKRVELKLCPAETAKGSPFGQKIGSKGRIWQNAYAERLIGSIPRECVDHVVVLGERHLRHVLLSYMKYFNEARTHLITEQGCADIARCPGRRAHSVPANFGRIASPIRPDLIFDRHKGCGDDRRWDQGTLHRFSPLVLIADSFFFLRAGVQRRAPLRIGQSAQTTYLVEVARSLPLTIESLDCSRMPGTTRPILARSLPRRSRPSLSGASGSLD